MSGVVGIVHLDEEPLDPSLIRRLTRSLAYRGPDRQCAVTVGNAAFGHTLLRLGERSKTEQQPFTIDGRRWIVGDARLDARRELIEALAASGSHSTASASDAELILAAHHAWGDACVDHLRGDFMFAIWDAERQQFFGARDQLGVKPFYYARRGARLVFSNSLDCVRLHPAVSRDLYEPALADFLLFGVNRDQAATSFSDIRRVPPAHAVISSPHGIHTRRYWTLPIENPIEMARDEYPERFTALLAESVRDRADARQLGVLMSGGLDSPTLAAVAQRVIHTDATGGTLHAITSVYDRLIPDRERHFAGLVADRLKIPIRFDVRDDEPSIADWGRTSARTPEPVENPPAFAAGLVFFENVSRDARVLFYGEGPDNALRYEWRPYLAHLTARRDLRRLAAAVSDDLTLHRRVPLWSSLRQLLPGQRSLPWTEAYPEWLDPDFAARSECRERWHREHRRPAPRHPVRPRGYDSFSDPRWQLLFENCDISGAATGTEVRHPFLDLRVLQFMLAVPAMPWCRNKLLIRTAMRTALPPEVIGRRKTSLASSPDFERIQTRGLPPLVAAPASARFLNQAKIPVTPRTPFELRSVLRAHGLNHWLHGLDDQQRSAPR